MITVFKKIWNFAEKEQSNIRKSIIVGFLCAAFNAMQMGGVYYVLVKIFDETLSVKDIAVVLGILLVKGICPPSKPILTPPPERAFCPL